MKLDPGTKVSWAKAFVSYYYMIFDTFSAGLVSLYQDSSMLTYDGQDFQGVDDIVEKLTSLPFQECKHTISTVDCQSSGPGGGMLVCVSGTFAFVNGPVQSWERHQLKFSQTFHLMPTDKGSFFVFNDIVRFN